MTTDAHDNNLQRFIIAQDGGTSTRKDLNAFGAAIEELRNGKKVGHWIWFIFPQIEIGQSEMARKYAIKSLAEADDFLKNQILHDRLLSAVEIVISQLKNGVHPEALLGGSTDCLKLSSSMTLFKGISQRLDDFVLEQVCGDVLKLLDQSSIPPCALTENWLQKTSTY